MEMNEKLVAKIVAVLGVLAVVVFIISQSAFVINPTNQAIVIELGNPKRLIRDEGLYWKVPFLQNIKYFEKRIIGLDLKPEEVIARDQKRIVVDSVVFYRIFDPLKFYQTVGNVQTARSRLNSWVRSSLRQVLGKENLADIVSGSRRELMVKIADVLRSETDKLGISVVDLRIKRTDLPAENSDAVYRRMQTARQREAMQIRAQGKEVAQQIRSSADREATVIVAKALRDAAIARGQGQKTAAALYNAASLKDERFYVFYRRLMAYKMGFSSGDNFLMLSGDYMEEILKNIDDFDME